MSDDKHEIMERAIKFRASIAALGFSISGFARFCGVNIATAQRWASGERDVPPTVHTILFLLKTYKINVREAYKAIEEYRKSS